jgi:hypothetical protein
MASDKERAIRKIDRAIDRHADDAGYGAMELIFQKRAQDMRKKAVENQSTPTICFEDVEGYADAGDGDE